MGGATVHADVRDAAAGSDQLGGEFERLGNANRLEGDVRAEPSVSSMTFAAASSRELLSTPDVGGFHGTAAL